MDKHSIIIVAGLVAGSFGAGVFAQTGDGVQTAASGQTAATAQPAAEAKPADTGSDAQIAEPKTGDQADPRTKLDEWHGSAALNLWATSISGNLGVRGQSAHVSKSFIEIVQAADSVFGFNGRVELGKGMWTGYVDGTYMNVQVEDTPTPAGQVDITAELLFLEFGIQAQVGHWLRDDSPPAGVSSPQRWIDLYVYAGGRYSDVELKQRLTVLGSSVSESRGWVDPLVGLRLGIDLCENWKVVINGDVGGFGCGGSQFAWAAQVLFDHRFDMWGADASLTFGYRALGENYAHQRALGEFKWDITLYGPIFGLTVRF